MPDRKTPANMEVIEVSASPRVEFHGDEQTVPRYYANHAGITTNLLDVRISFNQIIEQFPDRTLVSPQFILHVPHYHARQLGSILSAQLAALDEKVTQISEAASQKEAKP